MCITAAERSELFADRPGGRDLLLTKQTELILGCLTMVSFFDYTKINGGEFLRDFPGEGFFFFFNHAIMADLAALVSLKTIPIGDLDEDTITKQILEGMGNHQSDSARTNIREKPALLEHSFDKLVDLGLSPRREAFRIVDVHFSIMDHGTW